MKEIKRYLDSRIGQYSFYFEDLDSGYSYGEKDSFKMPSASCIKLPLAIILFREIEKGNIAENTEVFISKEDMIDGSGIIFEFAEREYSLMELVVAMLVQSDNTATNKIIELIGIENVNDKFKELELISTELNRKIRDVELKQKGIVNYTSSMDLAKCYKGLYNNAFLNEKHSSFIIKILKRQQIRNKICFYIPKKEWTQIASKPGSLMNVENDTCLIQTKKGNFVFTIMCSDLPNNVYGIVTISKASKMLWDIICTHW